MKIRFKPSHLISSMWRRFAPSALICLLLTFWIILSESITYYGSEVLQQLSSQSFNFIGSALLMSLLFATAASCLCERYRWHKVLPWLAAAAGAGTGALFVRSKIPEMIPVGVILCALALCLHAVSRKDAPAARLSLICGRFITASLVSGVLYGALSLSISAIFSLLLPEASYQLESIFYTSAACISFLLFAPCLFLGGLPEDKMPSSGAFQRFFSFLLAPFFLLPTGIILFYVVKITLTWSMPVGVMNGYSLYALTAFVFFHLILTGSEDKLSAWFRKWGGWLLIPIAIVQGIAVHMRVSAYGLTPSRIYGIVWTALCLAVILTSLLRRRANWFFLAAAAASLLIFCSPLNAENLTVMNQEYRLKAALERNNMLTAEGEIIANPDVSNEDQAIIYSAADYLPHVFAREGSLTAQLQNQLAASSFDSKALLFGFEKTDRTAAEWYLHRYRFNGTASPTKAEVRGYAYAELITITQRADSSDSLAAPDKEKETNPTRYGTADLAALTELLEAGRESDQPFIIDVPLTFVIDGEEINLAPLLAGSAPEDNSGVRLVKDDGVSFNGGSAEMKSDILLLPSGKKLHFQYVEIFNYSDPDDVDSISFTAWLLTPEETPAQ